MRYTYPTPLRRRKKTRLTQADRLNKGRTAQMQPASGHPGIAAGTAYVARRLQGVLSSRASIHNDVDGGDKDDSSLVQDSKHNEVLRSDLR
jgi:hypothetical protein